MNKLTKIAIWLFGFSLLASQTLRATNCGNDSPEGVTAPTCPAPCPPKEETTDASKKQDDFQEGEDCDETDGQEGVNRFRTYTANAHRAVADLKLFGGVGEHRLTWSRYANSRYDETAGLFGQGQNWRHSYQWQIADAGVDSQGRALLEIHYPEGQNTTFTKVDSTHWNPYLKITDRITQSGTTYTMQRANGWRYIFVRLDDGSYQMQNFADTQGNVYTFTYDTNSKLIRVTEPAGRYIEITYQDLLCNDVEFVTFATISGTPPAGWSQITVTDANQYRYLRYVGPDGSYSTVAEIEFYDTATNKLSGTAFGASPAYGPGKEFDKATDGLTNTWYSYSQTTKGFTGIDLGSGNATHISKVRFFPLTGYESRMNGGWFQGSLQAPVIVSVIASVQGSDGRSVSYDYQTVTDPSVPGASYAVLTAAHYGDGTQATYTYAQTMGGTQPSLITASDPQYRGAGSKIKYEYVTTRGRGLIWKERNLATNNELVRLDTVDADNLKVTYANGTVRKFYQPTDKFGHVVKRTDGLGKETNYSYGTGSGLLKSKTDAESRTTFYNYSIYGHLLSRTNADNSVEVWTRDDLDLVLTYKDELGRVTTYNRDAQHRVTRIDYPDGSFETFDYNQWGQVTTNRLRNGGLVINTYDAVGLKTSTTDPLLKVTSYAYYTNDLVAAVRDARLNVTTFEYNERGQVTKVINPGADVSTRSFGYDQFGNKTAETNELGFVTSWAYDEFNRVTTNRNPLGFATIYSYGLPGGGGCGSCSVQDKPIKITLPSNKQIAMTYDLEWRKLSETLGYGTADAATTQWRHDAVGNVVTNIDANGKTWVSTFDERNRRKTSADPLSNTTQWGYDPVGNIVSVTRADGGITTNQYDSMNRVYWTRDPKMQVTQFGYDAAGNMTALTDANSHVYQFTYDLLNRRISMIYPNNSSHEDYTFDEVGNMKTYRNRAGNVRTFTYDERNRETDSVWDDGVTPAVHRSYDAASRLLTLNNANAQLSYGYDAANQLTAETNVVNSTTRVASYTYDADGNRASMAYPSGITVNDSYSARNQLTAESISGTTIVGYQYDLNGNRITKTLANNTSAAYNYDDASRLLSLVHSNAAGLLARFDYTLNAVGNRTSKTEVGTAVPAVRAESYSYDAIDQVTAVAYASNSIPVRNVSYQYDPVGNRSQTTENGSPTGYTANNLNQYTVVDGSSLAYDNKGNLASTVGGILGGWSYTYDAQNRLLSVVGGPSSVTATFLYDARNRCVARTINGVTTYLTYDGWSLIEERNASGTLLDKYVHGASIDEIIVRYNGSPIYYHHDGLGSTVALTDNTGALAESYQYDVFGAPTILAPDSSLLSSSAVSNRFLFTGREYLTETGLYDYRNRFYSATLARFLQTDPINFDAEDLNLYRYVVNSPINWADEDGLQRRGNVPRNPNAPRRQPPPRVPETGGRSDPLETPEEPPCRSGNVFIHYWETWMGGLPTYEPPEGAVPPPPPGTPKIPEWRADPRARPSEPDRLDVYPPRSNQRSQPAFSQPPLPSRPQPVSGGGVSGVAVNSPPARVPTR